MLAPTKGRRHIFDDFQGIFYLGVFDGKRRNLGRQASRRLTAGDQSGGAGSAVRLGAAKIDRPSLAINWSTDRSTTRLHSPPGLSCWCCFFFSPRSSRAGLSFLRKPTFVPRYRRNEKRRCIPSNAWVWTKFGPINIFKVIQECCVMMSHKSFILDAVETKSSFAFWRYDRNSGILWYQEMGSRLSKWNPGMKVD